ncbi:MAG TPA: NifB/NifX family molybdenum-iron cluster-binding protein [Spirochaetota bacterium]|nr:NifB/NifX family molybdenum-iron cluster-binding protein [Spirochaetota bacterium]HPC39599.1 NifB/NifX family molybdenum-iron cluster-binding protein [Spirochaetota bacterium]HPL17735.1 NifB/NifX family molybdenum-iron cluster-binding protein [Spirochaetota bacterium]HQF09494.1 NifB/NifX family molybdenum-iron cluster-binding protein [Spirochaetota bacterium]HQH98177.1 NifB/NifX family molybdenum-iron cluster-binding protein [Spirochaetota bacterium]
MKIALPVSDKKLCLHFGHCEQFEVFDVDEKTKHITGRATFSAPPHEPGLLPRWLADKGVKCVIAGGMGSRAVAIFKENGVNVITGAQPGEPAAIVRDYLEGRLVTGSNVCDH